jgi:DNA-directed RNA polymerase specialized sigma24 family protein
MAKQVKNTIQLRTLTQQERITAVRMAEAKLTPFERELLAHYYLEGYTLGAIAEETRQPYRTVQSEVRVATDKFKTGVLKAVAFWHQ